MEGENYNNIQQVKLRKIKSNPKLSQGSNFFWKVLLVYQWDWESLKELKCERVKELKF